MPDTLELVREALRDEAISRGIHDGAMVDLCDLTKVAVDNGAASTADIEVLVRSMHLWGDGLRQVVAVERA